MLASLRACPEDFALTSRAYRGTLGAVKQQLQWHEINFSAVVPGTPPDGAVPGAVLPPGPQPEGHRDDARRVGGHGLAAAQARLRRGPRTRRARPPPHRGVG